ncbi:hypothetical protein BH11PSE12_BH11PSE12_34210 [soil metagenome]
MLKTIVLSIVFLSVCTAANASSSGCSSSAKFFKLVAEWRDAGVPIKESRKRVEEINKNSPPDERTAWVEQVNNVYIGKLKGFDPGQTELTIYNVCMGTMKMP